MPSEKTIHICYYASLREESGLSNETVKTDAATTGELYEELAREHGFTLSPGSMRVAVNDKFEEWDYILKNNDQVVFIPPVSGG